MNYYLWIGGQEQGPYSLEEIQQAVNDGGINPEQTARTESSSEWQPLHQIARLKRPVSQKLEPNQKTASAAQPTTGTVNRPVDLHLSFIRRNTCYGVLRGIIEVCFALLLLSITLLTLNFTHRGLVNERLGEAILVVAAGLLAAFLVVAARQSALLLIDIADTLLHEHTKDRNR